jgi:hypothetical protein
MGRWIHRAGRREEEVDGGCAGRRRQGCGDKLQSRVGGLLVTAQRNLIERSRVAYVDPGIEPKSYFALKSNAARDR